MSSFRLFTEIISRSTAKDWDAAKLEWRLSSVQYADAEADEHCLCGHRPIVELCDLRNTVNGNEATVGNCCVRKFLGLPSGLIFRAIRRVQADSTKSLNAETIKHAYLEGWLSPTEVRFYHDVMCKRRLTPRQFDWKVDITAKVMKGFRMAYKKPLYKYAESYSVVDVLAEEWVIEA